MPLDPKLRDPFEGPEPGGTNLRYEPIYDQIKEARTEEADIPQGDWRRERKTADWPTVVRLCTEVIEKRSKDLQVAAWLTEGLLHRDGFSGLREGLALMRELLERCWDHLYPEIDDGDLDFRAAPVEWVGNYLDMAVRKVPLTREEYGYLDYRGARDLGYEKEVESQPQRREARQQAIRDGRLTSEEFDDAFSQTPKSFYTVLVADVEGSLSAVDQLDEVAGELFGDAAPTFRKLRDGLNDVHKAATKLLERKLETEPDAAPTPEDVPEHPTGDAGSAGSGGSTGGEPTDSGAGTAEASSGAATASAPAGTSTPARTAAALTRISTRDQAAAAVAAAAAYLRTQDPTDPAPYLLVRSLRLGELRRGEDHIDPRLLEAPPTETRTRLKGLLLDARYDELIAAAEEVTASAYGRGWLDLQRYVVTALEALGPTFEPAAQAVRKALGDLLAERPELASATLMDDSPTANHETLEWLNASGILPAEGERAARAPAKASLRAPTEATSQRASDLVRAGRHRQAIELLMREADQEHSPRARFLRRAEAARIMANTGLESIAIPILRQMLDRIERHTLEDWEEGETVAVPMGLLWRCLRSVEGDSSQAQELYKRVCRLDPVAALHLTPSDSSDSASPGSEHGGVASAGGVDGAAE